MHMRAKFAAYSVVLWVFYRFYGGSLEQLQRPVISRQSLQAPAMG